MKKQLSEPIEFLLNKPSGEMWDGILSLFNETLSKAESSYLAKAQSLSFSSPLFSISELTGEGNGCRFQLYGTGKC